jgi:hypothetical protein
MVKARMVCIFVSILAAAPLSSAIASELDSRRGGIEPSDRLQTFLGRGNLLSVRLEMGDDKARIFLVGNEAAQLSLTGPEIFKITVFRNDGSTEELHYSLEGGYYTVPHLRKDKGRTHLSVSTRYKLNDKLTEEHIKVPLQPAK